MRRAFQLIERRFGIRITRATAANRFNAEAETLRRLRSRGYDPQVVIDGGANVGEWARMARAIFPVAHLHLLEPQDGCRPALDRFAAATRNATVHPVAVTCPGVESVRMGGGGADATSTGNLVLRDSETFEHTRVYPATTLDALFAGRITRPDRTLLKLDLEGHELEALEGAAELLKVVEVVAVELQFFEINRNARPTFAAYVARLDAAGFDVYDVATLSGRPRDQRLRQGDFLFVRRDSQLAADIAWQ